MSHRCNPRAPVGADVDKTFTFQATKYLSHRRAGQAVSLSLFAGGRLHDRTELSIPLYFLEMQRIYQPNTSYRDYWTTHDCRWGEIEIADPTTRPGRPLFGASTVVTVVDAADLDARCIECSRIERIQVGRGNTLVLCSPVLLWCRDHCCRRAYSGPWPPSYLRSTKLGRSMSSCIRFTLLK